MFSLFGYFFSGQDMIIIAVVVLLLFGNRLPSVMRSLGRGVVEFKKGVSGVEDEVEEAVRGSPKKEAIEEAPKAKPAAETEAKTTEGEAKKAEAKSDVPG